VGHKGAETRASMHNMPMSRALLALSIVWATASIAWALADNPWPTFSEPAPGPARAIGEYSRGCVQGAVPLPLEGLGYQVMRPGRRRYFGHPALVDFVSTLARGVHERKLGVLLIGDLSQPRGGRAPGGHASHQSGLDVDIWFWHPPRAEKGLLPLAQRESLKARSVIDETGTKIRPPWQAHVSQVLALAASDARVDRLFVNPVIKRELCASEKGDRAYLRKVRPWHGHDDHFHARLGCPAGDSACKPQEPVAQGDGCDELAFWFDAEAQAERRKAQQSYQRNVDHGRGWPTECDALIPQATPDSAANL
jgi:penicillin-insensitive murein endopeptidase